MDVAALRKLDPKLLRQLLPDFLTTHLATHLPGHLERLRQEVDTWSDEVVAEVVHELEAVGAEPKVYRAQPDTRRLARVWCRDVFPSAAAEGVEHLQEAARRGPVVLLSNHLAYLDSLVLDAALAGGGHAALADRVLSAAGPKVYSALFRRFAAVCLNTLPVPQSTSLAHTERLGARELARLVQASLDTAGQALDEGYHLLLFGEGSRSRTGRMGPYLKGVHRYLSIRPDLQVVPTALWGSERVMPVGDERIHPGPVAVRFGEPMSAEEAGGSRPLLERAAAATAALLPEAYQPLPSLADDALADDPERPKRVDSQRRDG